MKFVQNPDWGILKDVAVTLGSSKSSAFGMRQKHRIPEGNRKQTKGYPEGIPEGFSDSGNYMVDPTFWKASWIPKDTYVYPEAKRKVSGSHIGGKSSIWSQGV